MTMPSPSPGTPRGEGAASGVPGPPATPVGLHPATPARLAWLEGELARWQAASIIEPGQAAAIRAGYVAQRRFTLTRVVATLGSCFVGAGLIWLVASNLDQLHPLARFALVAVLWLGLVAGAEILAGRRERLGDLGSPITGALRSLAAAAFGAVVFQGAQSLQVTAYEPALVGAWGLGALASAYAVRGVAPLVLGIALTTFWFFGQSMVGRESQFTVAAALLTAGTVAAAVAVLHARRGDELFAGPWRELGAVAVLVGLFAGAFSSDRVGVGPSPTLMSGLVVAAVLATAAVVLGRRWDRAEVLLAVVALLAGVGICLWTVPASRLDVMPVSVARAVAAVVLYLIVASGYAVLGAVRDTPRLTVVASAALVLFVTVQAFAVFAPILPGALVFLIVGAVLLGTGYLADRGRRRLVVRARELAPDEPPDSPRTAPEGR